MVEMAFGLPYKDEDHTTAVQFIDAQLEKINSQAVFAREQDRLEMIRILHAARVDSDNGKTLDLEIILNLVGGIFKPEDESAGDEASLQAALSAQVRRTNYEHRGMATQERKPIKKNSDQRSPKQSGSDLSKLMQVVFDMKAEMGCMRKAMINAGMSFDKSPNEPRIREQFVNGKQKNKFAGAAKKNKASKVAQRSLTLHDKNELTDSDDEDQPLAAKVAIVAKPRKHVSPRTMNALMVGITRRSSEFRRISDSDASVDRELDGEDADAQTSFNGSLHDDLFGNNV